MKSINFYTEKRGVNPDVRKAVKEQALAHANIDLSTFEKVDDFYCLPIATDIGTGETIYLKVSVSVGAKPTKAKKKAKATTETVDIGSLFGED